jgi:hypothetical protein
MMSRLPSFVELVYPAMEVTFPVQVALAIHQVQAALVIHQVQELLATVVNLPT